MNALHNRQGFTLIELLIVVAIVGILAAVAITSYVGLPLKAARSQGYTDLEALLMLEEQFFAENGAYTNFAGVACAADQPGSNITRIQQGGFPAVQAQALPGFKPASGNSGNFSFCVDFNTNLAGPVGNQVPCFRAQAFGNTNTRVAGDIFRIDCNNNRNF